MTHPNQSPMAEHEMHALDYHPQGIVNVREELIKLRDESLAFWPECMADTVLLTNTIGLLASFAEIRAEELGVDVPQMAAMFEISDGNRNE